MRGVEFLLRWQPLKKYCSHMDHYPSPFEPTRDVLWRRALEWIAAAGISGLLALAVTSGEVRTVAWLFASAATVGSLIPIGIHEVRLASLNKRAWTSDEWQLLRENEYRRRQGVFLTYSLAPVEGGDEGRNWWRATFRLVQHGAGPLSRGEVKEVEYSFGPRFSEGIVTAQSPKNEYGWETNLHGSVFVVARVKFSNPLKRPLLVEQYVVVPPR